MADKVIDLPKQPKIPERFSVIEARETEVRLQSMFESFVLREKSQTEILVKLLPLLNGRHDIDNILDRLTEFDASTVIDVIRQLTEKGLVEDETETGSCIFKKGELERYKHQITFFSNFLIGPERMPGSELVLDLPKDKFELQETLKNTKVVMFGLGRIGSNILRSLVMAGVGEIVGVDPEVVCERDIYSASWFINEDVNSTRGEVLKRKVSEANPFVKFSYVNEDVEAIEDVLEMKENCSLVIVSADNFSPSFHEELNKVCLERGITWTSCRTFGFEIDIGPTVIPGETPCYKCFDLRRKGNINFYDEYILLENYLKANEFYIGNLNIDIGAGFAALEVLKILTNFTDPATYANIFSFNLLTFESRLHPILKLPRCPHCGSPSIDRPTINIWE